MPSCEIHPDRAKDLACTRCGDFTCAACVADFPPEAALCPGCVEHLAGTPTPKIRLTGWKPAAGSYPSRCPGCFAPATTKVQVEQLQVPFCDPCASVANRHRRWTLGLGCLGTVAMLTWIATGFIVSKAQRPPFLPFFLTWAVATLGASVAGWVLKKPGFRVLRRNRSLPSFQSTVEVEIADARYARLFTALNAAFVTRT